jgi:hypothetical protein
MTNTINPTWPLKPINLGVFKDFVVDVVASPIQEALPVLPVKEKNESKQNDPMNENIEGNSTKS